MGLSKQFQACWFFLTKRSCARKSASHLEVYSRVKNRCLSCLVLAYFCFVSWFLLATCFCAREVFSSNKKKEAGLKLSWKTYFAILLACTPIELPVENLFVCTYFYLWLSVRIFFFMRIFLNLFLFIIICENLFFKTLRK